MARRPVIGIMGAGSPSDHCLTTARRLGRLVAEAGWVLLTGGRPAGVMAAASAGAKEVPGSLTVGVLPSAGDEGAGVCADVDLAVFTGMGDGRNVVNVLSSDVVVACGVEGPGTASEVALALTSRKPVVLVAAAEPAVAFFRSVEGSGRLEVADTPEAAMPIIRTLLQARHQP